MSIYDEAKTILNKYRNQNYNSSNQGEHELAMAIDAILPRFVKIEELLTLYKELSFIRFYLVCATDDGQGQDLMYKDDLITRQIKRLEGKMK